MNEVEIINAYNVFLSKVSLGGKNSSEFPEVDFKNLALEVVEKLELVRYLLEILVLREDFAKELSSSTYSGGKEDSFQKILKRLSTFLPQDLLRKIDLMLRDIHNKQYSLIGTLKKEKPSPAVFLIICLAELSLLRKALLAKDDNKKETAKHDYQDSRKFLPPNEIILKNIAKLIELLPNYFKEKLKSSVQPAATDWRQKLEVLNGFLAMPQRIIDVLEPFLVSRENFKIIIEHYHALKAKNFSRDEEALTAYQTLLKEINNVIFNNNEILRLNFDAVEAFKKVLAETLNQSERSFEEFISNLKEVVEIKKKAEGEKTWPEGRVKYSEKMQLLEKYYEAALQAWDKGNIEGSKIPIQNFLNELRNENQEIKKFYPQIDLYWNIFRLKGLFLTEKINRSKILEDLKVISKELQEVGERLNFSKMIKDNNLMFKNYEAQAQALLWEYLLNFFNETTEDSKVSLFDRLKKMPLGDFYSKYYRLFAELINDSRSLLELYNDAEKLLKDNRGTLFQKIQLKEMSLQFDFERIKQITSREERDKELGKFLKNFGSPETPTSPIEDYIISLLRTVSKRQDLNSDFFIERFKKELKWLEVRARFLKASAIEEIKDALMPVNSLFNFQAGPAFKDGFLAEYNAQQLLLEIRSKLSGRKNEEEANFMRNLLTVLKEIKEEQKGNDFVIGDLLAFTGLVEIVKNLDIQEDLSNLEVIANWIGVRTAELYDEEKSLEQKKNEIFSKIKENLLRISENQLEGIYKKHYKDLIAVCEYNENPIGWAKSLREEILQAEKEFDTEAIFSILINDKDKINTFLKSMGLDADSKKFSQNALPGEIVLMILLVKHIVQSGELLSHYADSFKTKDAFKLIEFALLVLNSLPKEYHDLKQSLLPSLCLEGISLAVESQDKNRATQYYDKLEDFVSKLPNPKILGLMWLAEAKLELQQKDKKTLLQMEITTPKDLESLAPKQRIKFNLLKAGILKMLGKNKEAQTKFKEINDQLLPPRLLAQKCFEYAELLSSKENEQKVALLQEAEKILQGASDRRGKFLLAQTIFELYRLRRKDHKELASLIRILGGIEGVTSFSLLAEVYFELKKHEKAKEYIDKIKPENRSKEVLRIQKEIEKFQDKKRGEKDE